MKRKVKLVIADIDGTLVSKDKKMGELTKKMLQKLHDEGVLLGIASGRPCGEHLSARAAGWGFDFQFDVLIGMNGGQLWDTVNDTHSEYYPLKKEYIKEIIEFMDPTGVNCYVYRGDSTLCRWDDERMRASEKRNGEPMVIATCDEDMWEKDNNKLLYRCKDVEEAQMAWKCAEEHRSENYQFFRTAPVMIEFQDPRVNKGVAMEAFCKNNGISLDEVVAFGDAENDKFMLKYAGLGVCLVNGSDETKAMSDVITDYDNDNDGVGHFIEDYIL